MLRTSIRMSIDLNEHEVRRIRCILDHIESRYSRLASAVPRILHCRLPERFDRLRFNLYVDVNDLHRQYCTAGIVLERRRLPPASGRAIQETRANKVRIEWTCDPLPSAMPLLFSYGTLQQESVQLSTFGRLLHGHTDELPGFELSLVPIDGSQLIATGGQKHHANATFNGRSECRLKGMVFEITEAELAAADLYEQRAAYTRSLVLLASGKQAWAYVSARSEPESS